MVVEWPVTPNDNFGEGTWLVGSDIAPGLYRTIIEGDSVLDSCYWARLGGLSGGFDDLLANGNVVGAAYVEILQTDMAFTSTCGPWMKVE